MSRFLALLITATLCFSAAQAGEPAKPLKALLVCGGCCHDYAKQHEILKKGLEERANLEVTVAYDPDKGTKHLNPVYASADWAKGFDVIIHDECAADVKETAVIDLILAPHKAGLPSVHLHCSMHSYRGEGYPKDSQWFQFTGLGTNGHGPQLPIDIKFTDKEHPITKGMEDWTTIKEELYNNLKVYDTAKPLARGVQGKADTVVIWTNEYNKATRVFGTTLGHNNDTVADPRYLDLVTRGLLWSCDKLNDSYLKPKK